MAKQTKFPERKKRIVDAAMRVFARKGFFEATVSEIAKEAKVSDATIYEYFPNKEKLLFEIPKEATLNGMGELKFLLQCLRGAANKLRAFIYHQLQFYQNNPDCAAVILLVLKPYREYPKTPGYETIRVWSRIVTGIIQEGIDSGEFKADTNPYILRTIILGAIEHAVISSLLLGRYSDLRELADPITDLVIAGINKEKMKTNEVNLHIILDPP